MMRAFPAPQLAQGAYKFSTAKNAGCLASLGTETIGSPEDEYAS